MGGGDLNMKKSWHPVLLTNQKRVWEVEKKAHDEKKKLDQLKKEIEEERQLAELQRLQEETTGRKRVEKLDWMYATPSTAEGGGALGGQRIGEKDMEEYLLGKKRVDEVLKQGDSIGAAHEQFIAVQNANTAQDIAAKVREDPLLAIKRQEQLAYQAMMNNPALKKQVKAIKEKKEGTKEERKEKKRREKEDRKLAKREAKDSRHRYSDQEDGHRHHERSHRRDPRDDDYQQSRSGHRRSRSPYDKTPRHRSRRDSPDRSRVDDDPERRDRHGDFDRRPYPRTRRDSPSRSDTPRRSGPPPQRRENRETRDEPYGRRNGYPETRQMDRRDDYRASSRPEALDLDSRPISSRHNGAGNGHHHAHSNGHNGAASAGPSAAEIRAQRLAQMQADAVDHSTSRLATLEERRKQDEARLAEENRVREQRGKVGDTKGDYVRQQEQILMGGGMDLADVLGRRGGKGLLREDM
ncbi:hypothetical protein QFC20_002048 [Naganishia adeliensis]|uniref:Uncharacterized protein n=1 Tax=Naganishia adeliensis TaxID=92952 RepID=A0ACC2WQQ6_9TREE|nr:hypothetical protein QFC20_002048 [Naganishia adeliensis]